MQVGRHLVNHAVVVDEQHPFADADLNLPWAHTGCGDRHDVGRVVGGSRRCRRAVTGARHDAQSDEQGAGSLTALTIVDGDDEEDEGS